MQILSSQNTEQITSMLRKLSKYLVRSLQPFFVLLRLIWFLDTSHQWSTSQELHNKAIPQTWDFHHSYRNSEEQTCMIDFIRDKFTVEVMSYHLASHYPVVLEPKIFSNSKLNIFTAGMTTSHLLHKLMNMNCKKLLSNSDHRTKFPNSHFHVIADMQFLRTPCSEPEWPQKCDKKGMPSKTLSFHRKAIHYSEFGWTESEKVYSW